MSASYHFFEELRSQKDLTDFPIDSSISNTLRFETERICQKMEVLPTRKESEALPELRLLRDVAEGLAFRLAPHVHDHENFERFLAENVFGYVVQQIIKAKFYNDKEIVRVADAMFGYLVDWVGGLAGSGRLHLLSLLNLIIDKDAEYYRSSAKETLTTQPFGEPRLANPKVIEFVESLAEGTKLDLLRSANGHKIWTRGVFIHKEHNYLKVRFHGEANDSFVQNNYFEAAPLGKFSCDFEWRDQLKVGDFVDFDCGTSRTLWKLHVISEIKVKQLSDGTQSKLAILHEIEESTKEYVRDPSFDAFSSSCKVFSPSIAKPRTRSQRPNLNFDDSDDWVFLAMEKKPRFAIMRSYTNESVSSPFLVRYLNLFGERGGFDSLLAGLTKETNAEVVGAWVVFIQSALDYLIQPFIAEHGEIIFKRIKEFGLENTEKNLRNFNVSSLSAINESITTLAQRIYPLDKAREESKNVMLKIAFLCLKSDFVQKQNFGANALESACMRANTEENKQFRHSLAEMIQKEGIFEKITKGHPSLISKSLAIFKLLFSEKMIEKSQMEFFWEQTLKADLESKKALISLLKNLSLELQDDEVNFFLVKIKDNIESINDTELEFVNWIKIKQAFFVRKAELSKLINEILWLMLQRKTPIKKELYKEIQKDFVKSLEESAPTYTRSVITQIREGQSVSQNLKLLRFLLKERSAPLPVIEIVKEEKIVEEIVSSLVEKLKAAAIETLPPDQQEEAKQPGYVSVSQVKTLPSSHSKPIFQILKFLDVLLFCNKEHEMLFNFSSFEKIWRVLSDLAIVEGNILKWVSSYIENEQKTSQFEKFTEFFHQNVRLLSRPNRQEFFQLFVLIFNAINLENKKLSKREVVMEPQYQSYYYYYDCVAKSRTKTYFVLQVPIDQLDGFNDFWQLYLESDSEDLVSKVGVVIADLVSNSDQIETDNFENSELYDSEQRNMIEKCLELLRADDIKLVTKSAGLLEKLMRKEEIRGLGVLRSLASLRMGEKITVSFEKQSKYKGEVYHLVMSESDTLAELITRVSQELKLPFEAIELSKNGEIVSILNMSSTLEQIGIKNTDSLLATEIATAEKHSTPLLDDKGKFTASALAVFSEIFETFSKNGQMTREDLAAMTSLATDGTECQANDDRISYVFSKYDTKDKGYLTEKQFIQFYNDATSSNESKQQTVRRNLYSLGYQSNLQTKKCQSYSGDSRSSIRKILLQKKELYDLLLSWTIRTHSDRTTKEISSLKNLLEFLTPNLDIIEAILSNPIESITSALDSPFLLYYRLIVIQNVISQPETISNIFAACERQFTAEKSQILAKSLLSFPWMIQTIERFGSKDAHISPLFFKILKILFSARVIEFHPEFVSEMRTFSTYFASQRTKSNKRTLPKKLNEKSDSDKDDSDKEDSHYKLLGKSISPIWPAFEIQFEFDRFQKHLIDSLKTILEIGKQDANKVNKSLLISLVSVVCGIDLIRPKIFTDQLKDNSALLDVLIDGLLSPSLKVKLIFKSLYIFFSVNNLTPETMKVMLGRLIECIKNNSESPIDVATHLLSEVAKDKNSDENLHKFFNFPLLFIDFSQKLMKMESKEQDFDQKEDQNLTSILVFLGKLLVADPQIAQELNSSFKSSLIGFLFKDCLFNIEGEKVIVDTVRCKSRRSREAVMELLINICRGDLKSTSLLMITGFKPLGLALSDFDFQKSNSLFSDFDRRGEHGYIGIKNLGCICYMIAMLQQFFCTPTFRYGILLADDGKPSESVEIKERIFDDNVFHQFQKMFTYLESSKRGSYDPIDFCLSYKDHDGQPINTKIQQDAQEFLNMIFDKLDRSLEKTSYKGLLESVYGGQTSNQFTCKTCGYVKENVEMFYNLSLNVKHCKNLQDSFEKMKEEEIISEYLCGNCKNKCDVSKRCLLKTLPNVMIVHLQKIVFDLDTMENVKLSSRFEFPMTINLKQFVAFSQPNQPDEAETNSHLLNEEGEESLSTQIHQPQNDTETPTDSSKPSKKTPASPVEAYPDINKAPLPPIETKETPSDHIHDEEEYEFRLVGVVVHRGNAENGHYTSLVNAGGSGTNSKFSWLEFDDSKVSPFDMSRFEEECFGGSCEQSFGFISDASSLSVSKSAYILIYDKVRKDPIHLKFSAENPLNLADLTRNLKDPKDYSFDSQTRVFSTPFFNLKPVKNQRFQNSLLEDNSAYIIERLLDTKRLAPAIEDLLQGVEHLAGRDDPPSKLFGKIVIQSLPPLIFGPLIGSEGGVFASLVRKVIAEGSKWPAETPAFIAWLYPRLDRVLANLSGFPVGNKGLAAELIGTLLAQIASFSPENTMLLDAIKRVGMLAVRRGRGWSVGPIVLAAMAESPAAAQKILEANLLPQAIGWLLERGEFRSAVVGLVGSLVKAVRKIEASAVDKKVWRDYLRRQLTRQVFDRLTREDLTLTVSVCKLLKEAVRDDRATTDLATTVMLRAIVRDGEEVVVPRGLAEMLKLNDGLEDWRLQRILGWPLLDTFTEDDISPRGYSFPCGFFSEKGLLELLPNLPSLQSANIILSLADAACFSPKLLEYLLRTPGGSPLISSAVFRWPAVVRRGFVARDAAEVAEATAVMRKFVAAAEALAAREGLEIGATLFDEDEIDADEDEEIFAFRKSVLIGRKVDSRLVWEFELKAEELESESVGLAVHADTVEILESKPTLKGNLALQPTDSLKPNELPWRPVEHILRISSFNHSSFSYFFKVQLDFIHNNKPKFLYYTGSLTSKTLLTIEKPVGAQNFGEVKVWMSFLKTNEAVVAKFEEDSIPEMKLIATIRP